MAQNNDIDLSELFAEDNLFQIYKKAPSFFSNTFNGWVFTITAACIISFAVLHVVSPTLREEYKFPFADTFTLWANAGAAVSSTILGFLIAGFAVLCTVLRPQTMLALQRIPNRKYGQTELKLLFVLFVEVLVQYTTLLFVSVLTLLIGGKSGFAAFVGGYLSRLSWLVPFALLHLCMVLWTLLFIVPVLTLKSFVFNLYSTLLLGIADAADDYQRSCMTIHCENAKDNRENNVMPPSDSADRTTPL